MMDLQELLLNFLDVVRENEDDYFDVNDPEWQVKMTDDFLATQQMNLSLGGVINWIAIKDKEPSEGIEVMASNQKSIKFDKWGNRYKYEWDNLPNDYRHWAHKPPPFCL